MKSKKLTEAKKAKLLRQADVVMGKMQTLFESMSGTGIEAGMKKQTAGRALRELIDCIERAKTP